jgi:hypothetical protein
MPKLSLEDWLQDILDRGLNDAIGDRGNTLCPPTPIPAVAAGRGLKWGKFSCFGTQIAPPKSVIDGHFLKMTPAGTRSGGAEPVVVGASEAWAAAVNSFN